MMAPALGIFHSKRSSLRTIRHEIGHEFVSFLQNIGNEIEISSIKFRTKFAIIREVCRHTLAMLICLRHGPPSPRTHPSMWRLGMVSQGHETQTDPNKTVSNAGTKSAPNCVTKFRHEIQSAPARNFVTKFRGQIMCKKLGKTEIRDNNGP